MPENSVVRSAACAVCTAAASGIHFGVLSCEACKGFFRRTSISVSFDTDNFKCRQTGLKLVIDERQHATVTATQLPSDINARAKNVCRACRYQKCLMAGMNNTSIYTLFCCVSAFRRFLIEFGSILAKQMGRQSNIFKHEMAQKRKQQQHQPHQQHPTTEDRTVQVQTTFKLQDAFDTDTDDNNLSDGEGCNQGKRSKLALDSRDRDASTHAKLQHVIVVVVLRRVKSTLN